MLSQKLILTFLFFLLTVFSPIVKAESLDADSEAIREIYDKMSDAVNNKDLATLFSYYAKDYIDVNEEGRSRPLDEARKGIYEQFADSSIHSINYIESIENVIVNDNRATVFTTSTTTIVKSNQQHPDTTDTNLIKERKRDTWIKGGAAWLLNKTESLSSEMVLNNTPVFKINRINENLVSEGQVIDMGNFSVQAPRGQEWKIQKNDSNGMVQIFKQQAPKGQFTTMGIMPGILKQGLEQQTEDYIANIILNSEAKNMKDRGASRSYAPNNLSKEITIIGKKRLYGMNYTIIDRSRDTPIEVKYAMFLYIPPDYKLRKVFYSFIIGEPYKIGETTYETNLTPIYALINSFQIK